MGGPPRGSFPFPAPSLCALNFIPSLPHKDFFSLLHGASSLCHHPLSPYFHYYTNILQNLPSWKGNNAKPSLGRPFSYNPHISVLLYYITSLKFSLCASTLIPYTPCTLQTTSKLPCPHCVTESVLVKHFHVTNLLATALPSSYVIFSSDMVAAYLLHFESLSSLALLDIMYLKKKVFIVSSFWCCFPLTVYQSLSLPLLSLLSFSFLCSLLDFSIQVHGLKTNYMYGSQAYYLLPNCQPWPPAPFTYLFLLHLFLDVSRPFQT